MPTRDNAIEIAVDGRHIAGTLVMPAPAMPGILLVHGWGGSQEQYLARAREIAALGCACLTFDLRGHARDQREYDLVTREDNFRDVIAAYDRLVAQPAVDEKAIAVVGSSYGGYLAAILTSRRRVRWLGLRAPALYWDEDWTTPKRLLDREKLAAYRRQLVPAQDNRALSACADFAGDVLVVESQFDNVVPHPVIASYLAAFMRANSLTHRVIEAADHGLSEVADQQAYTTLLVRWVTEMVLGARHGGGVTSGTSSGLEAAPADVVEGAEEMLDELARDRVAPG